MRNFLILFFFQIISTSLFAVNKNWTGAVSNDWAVAGNWSPSGVPEAADVVIISTGGTPELSSGTVSITRLYLYGALTVGAGATLTVTGDADAAVDAEDAILTNNGTMNIGTTGYTGEGLTLWGTTAVTNTGQLTIHSGTTGVGFSDASSLENSALGVLTINSQINLRWFGPTSATLINHGVINCDSGVWGINNTSDNTETAVVNDGTININTTYGIFNPGIIENQACGVIAVKDGDYQNPGTTTNAGSILIKNELLNGGTFTNNAILNYGSLSGAGTFTNTGNNAIIVNNTTPIFTYGGSFAGDIEIYKDEDLQDLAGTFTAPNSFSPDGLTPGVQTLYALIAPPGTGVCSYTVPFSYTMAALPVTLINFEAAAEGQVTHLSWSTAAETNSNYFEVQHSTDAKNWIRIGQVAAHGESTSQQNYQFMHAAIRPGVQYYRLKMVDFDSNGREGGFAFSRMVSVVSSSDKQVIGNFYPNPSSGTATIEVPLAKAGIWTITTLDSKGRVLGSERRELQAGSNQVRIIFAMRGLNLIRFSQGANSFVRKLVVN